MVDRGETRWDLPKRERERDRGGEEIGLKFRSKYSQVCERVFLSCEFARRGGKKKLKERSSTERKILLMAKFDVERKKPIIFHFTDRKREVPSVAQLRRSGSSPRIEGGVSHTSRRRSGYNWRLWRANAIMADTRREAIRAPWPERNPGESKDIYEEEGSGEWVAEEKRGTRNGECTGSVHLRRQ